MYRKEAAELLPFIKAFSERKDIEMRSKNPHAQLNGWAKTDEYIFGNFEYRIKPESKYRPFKDVEECLQEMQKHKPFGWVKNNETQSFFVCKAFGNLLFSIGIEDKPYNYNEVLRHYTFADGTPFGVKEEE